MKILIGSLTFFLLLGCSEKEASFPDLNKKYPSISSKFSGKIDLNNLDDYETSSAPNYIRRDNTTPTNQIDNKKALLGRVLFYDKNLSSVKTVACANCHIQAFAFSDTSIASQGINGLTGRHSMRLVNSRFAEEDRFFWDERAETLESQTTMPIKDHAEMGFSGENGAPDFQDLLTRLSEQDYYKELFMFAFDDSEITESRIQLSIAQFIRSIESYDAKYDKGRALANGDLEDFSNFSQEENRGKNLFLTPPVFDSNGTRINGGLGCGGCHRAPEFDIDPTSGNNGIISSISKETNDLLVFRSPSLRDIFNSSGNLNGPLMHTGEFSDLDGVLNHYSRIEQKVSNPFLDPRLTPRGIGQKLDISQSEKESVIAFLKTLSGNQLYSSSKWSDPF